MRNALKSTLAGLGLVVPAITWAACIFQGTQVVCPNAVSNNQPIADGSVWQFNSNPISQWRQPNNTFVFAHGTMFTAFMATISPGIPLLPNRAPDVLALTAGGDFVDLLVNVRPGSPYFYRRGAEQQAGPLSPAVKAAEQEESLMSYLVRQTHRYDLRVRLRNARERAVLYMWDSTRLSRAQAEVQALEAELEALGPESTGSGAMPPQVHMTAVPPETMINLEPSGVSPADTLNFLQQDGPAFIFTDQAPVAVPQGDSTASGGVRFRVPLQVQGQGSVDLSSSDSPRTTTLFIFARPADPVTLVIDSPSVQRDPATGAVSAEYSPSTALQVTVPADIVVSPGGQPPAKPAATPGRPLENPEWESISRALASPNPADRQWADSRLRTAPSDVVRQVRERAAQLSGQAASAPGVAVPTPAATAGQPLANESESTARALASPNPADRQWAESRLRTAPSDVVRQVRERAAQLSTQAGTTPAVAPAAASLQQDAAQRIVRDLSSADPVKQERGKKALEFASPEVKNLAANIARSEHVSAAQTANDAGNSERLTRDSERLRLRGRHQLDGEITSFDADLVKGKATSKTTTPEN